MAAALVVVIACGSGGVSAKDDGLTIGVIGDMPYTAQQRAAFPAFIDAMSADPSFQLVIHLGDIKSGSMACTDTYI